MEKEISKEVARKFLRNDKANGKPLTRDQERKFGAIAGGWTKAKTKERRFLKSK